MANKPIKDSNNGKINNFFSSKKNSNLIKEISEKYLNNINQLEADISNLSKEEMTHKIENLKQNPQN